MTARARKTPIKKANHVALQQLPASVRMSDADLARARRVLMRADPKLGELIKRVGRCEIIAARARPPFESLVRIILSQQLSGKVADVIFERVAVLVGGVEAMSATTILAVSPDAFRKAGVSGPKISYLRDLAERVADGRLPLDHLETMTDLEVAEAITSVKGLGRWSADMFLMFRLNRPDILPVGDLGIVKGVQKLFGMKSMPKPKTMERLTRGWRPYRTVACWYLWRV
ncbi:MAG TPA: DNA-3-methyladenine glycosylase [Vicinamibacterales bacterium]|nr:DNA-3-methyladenine glycosylase [Vicinamibacterales bacterium]